MAEKSKETFSVGEPYPLTFQLEPDVQLSVSLGVWDSLLEELAQLGLETREQAS